MSWDGKRVLVTGGGGFIGSHLVEALVEKGASVRALVHYNSRNDWGNLERLPANVLDAVDVVAGDIQDGFGVARMVEGCEVVFHLAALIGIPYSYVAPAAYVGVNITGTLNVLEAARTHGVKRVVHTSTSETYGTARYTPMDEAHPLQGQSPYSASKIAADKLAESYHRSFDLPVATLRPFNTFGPRQSLRAVIPTIASQALAGGPVRLGSTDPIRDFTFVTDTARAFIAVAESDAAIGSVLNAGNGRGINVGDLASRILGLVGADVEIEPDAARVRPKASEVDELVCDPSLIRERTGWQPEVSLDDGLTRVIAWLRENASVLKHGMYNV